MGVYNILGSARIPGKYSVEDLRDHISIMANDNVYRDALLMLMALDAMKRKQTVMIYCNKDHFHSLTSRNCLLYAPGAIMMDPERDASVIIQNMNAGKSVIVDIAGMGMLQKNALGYELMNRLHLLNTNRLSFFMQTMECLYPRKRSYSEHHGIHSLMHFLNEKKGTQTEFVVTNRSPDEIPIEVRNICAVQIFGQITSPDCMRSVAKTYNTKIEEFANKPDGIMQMSKRQFQINNPRTATRFLDSTKEDGTDHRHPTDELPLEMAEIRETVFMQESLPHELALVEKVGKFDPLDPDGTKCNPGANTKEQEAFEQELTEEKEQSLGLEPGRATMRLRKTIPAKATAPTKKSPDSTLAATGAITIANDNIKMASKSRAANKRFVGAQTSIAMVDSAGIADASRMVSIGLKVVNSRGGMLNAPLDGRLKPESLARQIIEDNHLQEAVSAASSVSQRSSRKGFKLSAPAYATAYYEALNSNSALARYFHSENFLKDNQDDLIMSLKQVSDEEDTGRRSEAQYQLLRNAMMAFVKANTAELPDAA